MASFILVQGGNFAFMYCQEFNFNFKIPLDTGGETGQLHHIYETLDTETNVWNAAVTSGANSISWR